MNSSVLLSQQELKDLLDRLSIKFSYDTQAELVVYCPFHDNRDTPSLNISKGPDHLWRCWNGDCAQTGNIISLLTKKGYTTSEARRLLKAGPIDNDKFVLQIQELFREEKPNEWYNDSPDRFINTDTSSGSVAKSYILGRGYTESSYEFFRMGFSRRKNMLVVPIFDQHNRFAGIIGRTLEGKRYQYSHGTPRNKIIWNLNNAKIYDEIILTEGALDAIKIWDAGYPNVGAVFGSSISKHQWDLIRTYFSSVICFFDSDPAGISVRDSVIEQCPDLTVYLVDYPEGIKDPGDLNLEQIRHMIANKKSSIEHIFAIMD